MPTRHNPAAEVPDLKLETDDEDDAAPSNMKMEGNTAEAPIDVEGNCTKSAKITGA